MLERLRTAVAAYAEVDLLVLHGSRARGEEHAGSDWDLAYLAAPEVDYFALLADVVASLRTDAVDLVDLRTASAVLRFRAASDGRPVYERSPGTFHDFAVTAAIYWCDVEPVVRRAHQAVLAGLGE